MTHMTEQLLTLARLDPENVVHRHRPVELADLATVVIALLDAVAQAKNIRVSVAGALEACLEGNAELLQVLLRNLIDNAIRYTPAGGTVTVSIRRQADAVELAVADSGPGIPEAERERAVHRFERLGKSRSEGSGLGLSIVARIAELHAATLALSTAAGGRGLMVSIVFPAARP